MNEIKPYSWQLPSKNAEVPQLFGGLVLVLRTAADLLPILAEQSMQETARVAKVMVEGAAVHDRMRKSH